MPRTTHLRSRRARLASVLCLIAAITTSSAAPRVGAAEYDGPRIYWDKSPRIVAYQLKRLTNEQIAALMQSVDASDKQHAPLFTHALTRPGMAQAQRVAALNTLVQLNGSDAVTELLSALEHVSGDDSATARELAQLLLTQPGDALTTQAARQSLDNVAAGADSGVARQIAYAAMLRSGRSVDAVWALASGIEGGTLDVMRALPWVRDRDTLAAFYPHVAPLLDAKNADARAAAIEAIGHVPAHEVDTFGKLAAFVTDNVHRHAAINALRRIPAEKWPNDTVAPLARTIVSIVEKASVAERTEPAVTDAVLLGEALLGKLPDDKAAPLRRKLLDLAVRVVRIGAIHEQLLFDTKYFAVHAGKPVQVVFENTDVIQHNLVICTPSPGVVVEIGTVAATMQPSADPNVKSYVPDSPKVLHATHLLNAYESERLSFTAPKRPGEYPFVCTFPGHFPRMYGVMIVVPDLEKWLKSPTSPADPVTGQPMQGQFHEVASHKP